MSAKLDKAIEAVIEASRPQGCWASHLTGDAKKFVARLKEEEAKGLTISRTAVERVLREAFDVKIGNKAVAKHLTGSCSCDQ